MKKIDLGQAFSIIANLGVISGIVLLAYELNQNRQMMQAQTRNAIAEHLSNMLVSQSLSPEYLAMQVRRRSGEALTPEEEGMYLLSQIAYWRYRENVYYQYQRGLFEESEYLPQREVWIQAVNDDEDDRAIWCGRRSQQSPAFNAEIDSQMHRPCE